jgi:hypothetical protein
MLLTITSTTAPATDLGYLLYKNPGRVQSFALPFGAAHVFYPEATAERCTAALLLDVDPVHLVRGRQAHVEAYVSDRPYVASSLLSVALAQVFGSALTGQSRERLELAATPLALTARLTVVHARGGEAILHRLFAPLGYAVTAEPHPLDAAFPAWGASDFFTVTLTGAVRLVGRPDRAWGRGHGGQAAGVCNSRQTRAAPAGDQVPRARVSAHHLRAGVHSARTPGAPAGAQPGPQTRLATREFALGLEALTRFVAGEPLRRVHECVFGVLALESEPVDPRL